MDFISLLAKWAVHGLVIFGVGLLPLSVTSQSLVAQMTAFGTGQLIISGIITFFGSVAFGAASTLSVPGVSEMGIWPKAGAISHITGVLFLLVAERRISSRVLDASTAQSNSNPTLSPAVAVDDDAMELQERHQTEVMGARVSYMPPRASGPHQRRIYLFTFALVLEEILSGIRLGYGAMIQPWKSESVDDDNIPHILPGPLMLSFLALFSQAATALGFATTLLSASLPVAECKRHVLFYAAAQPLATLVSYNVTMLSGFVPAKQPMLIMIISSFTGGLFVYAVLVVRTLLTSSRTTVRISLLARLFLMAAGAFLPHILPMFVSAYYVFRLNKVERDKAEVV